MKEDTTHIMTMPFMCGIMYVCMVMQIRPVGMGMMFFIMRIMFELIARCKRGEAIVLRLCMKGISNCAQ